MITDILLGIIILIYLLTILAVAIIGRKIYRIASLFLPLGVLSSPSTGDSTTSVELPFTASWKYKLMKLKAYFDNGYSLTSYPKWVIATVGIGSAIQGYNLLWLFAGGIAYGLVCFLLGFLFLKYGFFEASQEVNNQFNLFVKELRERKSI